VNFSSEGQWS